MNRRRLARVFWLGAAAILIAAAPISLAGLALVDRRLAAPLGWTTAGLAGVTFVLLVGAIWEWEGDGDGDATWRLALSAALFLLAGLVAATGLLLTTRPALRRLALAAGVLAAVAVSLTLVPIWQDEDPGSALAKAMGVAWVLAALAYLLAPVLQRWTAVGMLEGDERVLGSLDGVELVATRDPGDAVVVSDRPRSGERLVFDDGGACRLARWARSSSVPPGSSRTRSSPGSSPRPTRATSFRSRSTRAPFAS